MVYKEMRGRLGNQLFQYAAIKGILHDIGCDNEKIYLSFDRLVYSRNFKNDLVYYNINDYEEIKKIKPVVIQNLLIIIMKVIERVIKLFSQKETRDYKVYKFECFMAPFLNFLGIYMIRHGYYKFKKSFLKTKVFIGYLESPKYFDNIKNELLSLIVPKYDILPKNVKLLNKIKKTNSVCVTIRRGDFLDNKFKSEHYVCTPEYFSCAIEKMKKIVINPTFFVFSDDIEWCKENINFPEGTMFEEGNDPVYEKLRVMSSCKHFIISNSTFSWWAQYLSSNKDKVVIAPKKWKNYGYHDDIYEDTWHRI